MTPKEESDFRAFIEKWAALVVPYGRTQTADEQHAFGAINAIDFSKIYVDLCLSYYDDLKVRDFPADIIEGLKEHVRNVRTLLWRGQYDRGRWKRTVPFETCIEEGEKLVRLLVPNFRREIRLQRRNILKVMPLRAPDKDKAPAKAAFSNKFIGFGVPGSSTAAYAAEIARSGVAVNVENYTCDDVVFVSINGNRAGAAPMQEQTIELARRALLQGAVLLTDDEHHRNRAYNTGERLLSEDLLAAGATYEQQNIDGVSVGVWMHNCV